jgi:hypothetical protein
MGVPLGSAAPVSPLDDVEALFGFEMVAGVPDGADGAAPGRTSCAGAGLALSMRPTSRKEKRRFIAKV